MKLTRLTIVALAAVLLATAGPAAACGKKANQAKVAHSGCAKAQAAQAKLVSADGSGCAKATAAHAACCAKAQAALAANSSGEKTGCAKAAAEKSGCCAKARAAQATLASAGHAGCSKQAAAGCDKARVQATLASAAQHHEGLGCSKALIAAAGCSKSGACRILPAGRVKLSGTVACGHCDLHLTESCATVMRTAQGCLVQLTGERATELKRAAAHGTKTVEVRGTADAEGLVEVKRFKVTGDVPAAVGL